MHYGEVYEDVVSCHIFLREIYIYTFICPCQIDMRAEVGLLTRNVKIHGEMEDSCYESDDKDLPEEERKAPNR